MMGVSYSGEAVYEDGRPIHKTERMTEFDGKKIKTTEVVDGEKRERVYPMRTTTGRRIDESDIFQMMTQNNHTHHSVIERLMEGFVKTHPELTSSPLPQRKKRRSVKKQNKRPVRGNKTRKI